MSQLYCNSYHKFSNICKPEEGWYGQQKYCYGKAMYIVMIIFLLAFKWSLELLVF